MLKEIRTSLGLTGAHGIVRRYLVVNGFDGALTMLGLIVGFYLSGTQDMGVIVGACLGAAVALGVSGISSAYISETAEKQKELRELEQAMVKDMSESIHGRASRLLPLFVAFVNGVSPFVISLLIISPIWAAHLSVQLPVPPLELSFSIALTILFLLGMYLGKISGEFWLWSGIRALVIALVTGIIIVGLSLLEHG
jgi:predicted membrane protein (TIGR00267 family)